MTTYAKTELVGASYNEIYRMKDLLLIVHVVVKTLNLEISRCFCCC